MKKLFVLAIFLLGSGSLAWMQDSVPPAPIVNDEGGPVVITGSVTYTNAYFTDGVAQPLVILEDQAGFVDRDRSFLMPPESQTLGQITTDFFESPFEYSITLPVVPRGTLRDVDNDNQSDTGVQIFAVAYWNNTFGDAYLEERDLYGGGWSTAYASTNVSASAESLGEVIGGTYLVYASDDQQAFPSDFGADELLFTGDEPVVRLPQGYTLVNLDTSPFTFDRSARPEIDLIEGEAAASDFSGLTYTKAFDAMVDKMRVEYAFTEHKRIDWDALEAEFRPRFTEAEANGDNYAYRLALRDFLYSIPDGHIGGVFVYEEITEKYADGLGLAVRELDDGRIVVTYLLPGGPAEASGIEIGAEILAINGQSINEHISANFSPFGPFSTKINQRLEQLRWSLRFPSESTITVGYRNPGDDDAKAIVESEAEWDSFYAAELTPELTGFELPVEYTLLDSGYGYVQVYSFSDNTLLTVQLWERMIDTLNSTLTPGLIIDMRSNGGGDGFLAEQMAAYFFDEPHELGTSAFYDRDTDEFVLDLERLDHFFLPPESKRYDGEIAVLVGPSCYSACEFFTYAMTIEDRAAIVGQYPTGGLGGSVESFYMPDGETVQFTIGRAVDVEGNIHIEGRGVAPTVPVPVNEETVLSEGDPVLEAAIDYLNES
jgi:C-terminal processing protease CtpA/Prc